MLANATSIASELLAAGGAAPPTREAVLATFCAELERLMALSTEGVLEEYRACDLLAGRSVRVHHRSREEDDPRDYEATVLRVDPQGMLCVRRPDGADQALSGEEVSITPRGV